MQRSLRLLALVPLVSVLGCTEPAPRRAAPGRGAVDKAALYGDASLVPTRQGERARREVALAREIEAALVVLPSVVRARVDVELPEHAASPRVLAVVAGQPEADATALAARVGSIAHTVMGPTAAVEVVTEPSPASPASVALPSERTRWPLLLGVLGLGFFAGVLLERLRQLRSPSTARRPSTGRRPGSPTRGA
jgi:hypothetical protein